MTLDELTTIARSAYINATGPRARDDFKVAVLAVLEAVERECVPPEGLGYPAGSFDRQDAWNDCRNQLLDRLAEMRK